MPFVVVLVGVLVALGCGASDSTSGKTVGGRRNADLSSSSLSGPCAGAKVVRRNAPGVIEVIATCGPRSSALLIQGPSIAEAISYQKKPQVLYKDKTYRAGRCKLKDGELGCLVNLKGLSQVRERLQEPAGRACDVVSVEVTSSSECKEKNCNATFSLQPLFHGRPHGCQ